MVISGKFSDLYPSNEYKFRVKSKNDLGETDWTPYVSVWTDDAPLNLCKKLFFFFFFEMTIFHFDLLCSDSKANARNV